MLYLTSLLFITNAAYAFSKGLTIYGIAFISLTTTSVLFHTSDTKEPILFWYDQAMVWLVVGTGFLYFLHVPLANQLAALCTFVIITILFAGGYCTETLCFSPSQETQILCHGLVHIMSSIGHHVVISAIE
jgi:hypothetical protein